MTTIYTSKLKPGMVLAQEVRDINGRLLLSSGSPIGASHIRIFKMWGVTEVHVFGDIALTDAADPSLHPQLIAATKENILPLFAHVDLNHPAIKEIFRLAVAYRTQDNSAKKETAALLKKKPTEPRTIGNTKDLFKKLSEKNIRLPEIPTIVSELNEVIANPLSSAADITGVVNKSPSLTATLLKIVNSALYGCPSKIEKVSQAVTLIGTKEIFGLALGISVIAIFKRIPKNIINMYAFLRHSIACGIIARSLAAHKSLPYTEQLFVSGLLHDLGRVLLYVYFPEDSLEILSRYRESTNLLYEEEEAFLGYNHTHVVQYLMQHWKLPISLENNVFFHHNPSAAQDRVPAAIVHVADIIANAFGFGSSGERFVPPLDNAAWEELNVAPSCFEVVVKQAIHQFHSLEAILQN